MGMYMPEPPLEPKEEPMYLCPVCGEELNFDDKVYRNCGGTVIGCQHCIEEDDAEDVAHLLDKEE
jgi:hypothetical protein